MQPCADLLSLVVRGLTIQTLFGNQQLNLTQYKNYAVQ